MKYTHVPSSTMTGEPLRTVHLKAPTILRLDSGVEFRVEPAGDGITIHPHAPANQATAESRQKRGGGRRPSPETQALRDQMRSDAQNGGIKDASHYIAWLRALRPEASESSLQQIVYRERRLTVEEFPAARPAPRQRRSGGRAASTVAVTLRTKLEKDAAEGELRDASHYVRWLVDAADVGLKKARPVVYRELRRLEG